MRDSPAAAPPVGKTRYPRPVVVRGIRLILRGLWVVVLLGGVAAVAPNAWALYQRQQGLSGFLDPNNLSSLFYVPQLTQLLGGNTNQLIGAAVAAGAVFLILVVLGLWAGRDARRERRALRAQRNQHDAEQPAAASIPAAPAIPTIPAIPAAASPAAPAVPAPPPVMLAPAVGAVGEPPAYAAPVWAVPATVMPPMASGPVVVEPEPVAEPLADPAPAPLAESPAVAAPVAEPAFGSLPEQETEVAPEPVSEPLPEPLSAEPAHEPLAVLSAEPAGELITEPFIMPSPDPIAELSAEPIEEPVAEPSAEPSAASMDAAPAGSSADSLTEPVTYPSVAPAGEVLAERQSPSAATSYSAYAFPPAPVAPALVTPVPAPVAPIQPEETPAMTMMPPQNPPGGSNDTPAPAPGWWAPAPAGPATPAAPVAPPYASPPSQPYASPPSQPYASPPGQPYPPPPGQPYASPPSQPYYPPSYPPTMPGGQPTYPPQMPGGQPYYPPQPTTPGQPAAPGGLEGFGRAAMASVPLLATAVQKVNQITAPQTDETGISPAPFAAQAPGWQHSKPITDRSLGDLIDGWADTVVGMADKAPLMMQALVQDLPTHFRPATHALSTRLGMTGVSTLAKGIDIPASPRAVVRIAQSVPPAIVALPRLFLRLFGITIVGKQRDYLFAVTTPGAVVGIMITGAGRDLYMAWDLFIRRVWNEITVGLATILALVVGLFTGYTGARTAATLASYTGTSSSAAFIGAFLLGFLGAFFVTFAAEFAAAAVLGTLFKRDPFAFFRKDIDLFEAHDIASMSLSVDKALRSAATQAGIDAKLLRAKEEYTTGRGKRVI